MQNTTIEFVNNVADSGGSAIFTNDLGRCQWLNVSNGSHDTYIFNPPAGTRTPFNLMYVIMLIMAKIIYMDMSRRMLTSLPKAVQLHTISMHVSQSTLLCTA